MGSVKRLMPAFGAVVLLLWATPAHAQWNEMFFVRFSEPTPQETVLTWRMDQVSRWAGCQGVTVTILENSHINAAYSADRNTIILFRGQLDAWLKDHPDWVMFALLHETGHCMQFRRHDPDWEAAKVDPNVTDHDRIVEMDADAFAARVLTQMGYDGRRIEAEARLAFARISGISPDQCPGDCSHPSANTFIRFTHDHLGLASRAPVAV